jgi:hypothetical protein
MENKLMDYIEQQYGSNIALQIKHCEGQEKIDLICEEIDFGQPIEEEVQQLDLESWFGIDEKLIIEQQEKEEAEYQEWKKHNSDQRWNIVLEGKL